MVEEYQLQNKALTSQSGSPEMVYSSHFGKWVNSDTEKGESEERWYGTLVRDPSFHYPSTCSVSVGFSAADTAVSQALEGLPSRSLWPWLITEELISSLVQIP